MWAGPTFSRASLEPLVNAASTIVLNRELSFLDVGEMTAMT